jgi:hypothetical protein
VGILLQLLNYSPATGESGRRHLRTNENPKTQINTGFNEFDRAMDRDSALESSQFSVGSGQSTTNKEALYQNLGQFQALVQLGFIKHSTLDDRITFRNLQISVENKVDSVRKWYDPHNKEHGETKMLYPYGYIRMSEGMDGDHVDCFVGPNEAAENVYVITTNKAPDFRIEDEQKCMLGFDSEEQARQVFAAHYDKPGFFRSMKTVPYEEFERKVFSTKDTTRKKISFAHDVRDHLTANNNVGPSHDAVPGDYLGLPRTSLIGVRSIKGDPLDQADKVDRGFRTMDDNTNTTAIDGNSAAQPSGPAIY